MRQVRAALLAGGGVADTYGLAFYAAAAMEVLSELCATPLFYYRHGPETHLCATLGSRTSFHGFLCETVRSPEVAMSCPCKTQCQ